MAEDDQWLLDDLVENQVKTNLNGFYIDSFSFFGFSKEAKQPACAPTSLALTFSHSKVFIYQLSTDTLPLVTAGAP